MIKAVFFDIDGTLIAHGEKDFPPSCKETLYKLKEKGVKLFIATGRPPITMQFIRSMFDWDGYLCANGQYCFNNETVIHEGYMNPDDLRGLIDWVEEQKIGILLSKLDDNYRNEYIVTPDATKPAMDLKTVDLNHIIQVNAYIPPEMDDEFVSHLPCAKSARWTPKFADIIPKDGGKEIGIDYFCDYYGFTLDEVMVCGDGGNDITMLDHVKHSVAMGNASDEVKKHANFVTTDIHDDGIKNAMIHYGVIEQ